MDKYEQMLSKYKFVKNTNVNEEDLVIWLKEKIAKGYYKNLKKCSNAELEIFVKGIRPFIQMQLEVANELAREQIKKLIEKAK